MAKQRAVRQKLEVHAFMDVHHSMLHGQAASGTVDAEDALEQGLPTVVSEIRIGPVSGVLEEKAEGIRDDEFTPEAHGVEASLQIGAGDEEQTTVPDQRTGSGEGVGTIEVTILEVAAPCTFDESRFPGLDPWTMKNMNRGVRFLNTGAPCESGQVFVASMKQQENLQKARRESSYQRISCI